MRFKSMFIPALLLLSSNITGNAQQWTLVGGNTLTTVNGAYTRLAQDSAGNYYCSYYGGGLSQGSVQKYDGSSWTFLGGQGGVSPSYATYNGLAVTPAGEVYYSFQDGAHSNQLSVKKYSPSGNVWTDVGVGISGAIVNYQNLSIIPSSNLPVVSYNASGMRVKRYDGNNWVDIGASPLVTGNQVNHAMVAGNNDTVYVAVQTGTAYSVYKNHINAGSTVAWQPVGNTGFATGGSSNQFTVSLAIDNNNQLYLAYRSLASPDGSKIAVYKYDGSSWSPLGNQLFSANSVEHISLAVTAAGVPTVAFRENAPTDQTMVYTLSGNTWVSLGAASTYLGNYNALILDHDVPVLAFCESTGVNGGLVTVKKFNNGISVDSVRVSISNNAAAAISVPNGSLQLAAMVYPANISQAVTWSIIPAGGQATISSSGVVTAQANGLVYAKASAVIDPTQSDSVLISISNQYVEVTDLVISTQNNVPATISTPGGALQLTASISPVNASNQAINWSVVPLSGMAQVSATGLVTAQADGTVYAVASAQSTPSIADSLILTISNQSTTGVSPLAVHAGIKVYPNPVSGTLWIDREEPSADCNIRLYRITGTQVYAGVLRTERLAIDMHAQASGTYVLEVRSGSHRQSYCIIKP